MCFWGYWLRKQYRKCLPSTNNSTPPTSTLVNSWAQQHPPEIPLQSVTTNNTLLITFQKSLTQPLKLKNDDSSNTESLMKPD